MIGRSEQKPWVYDFDCNACANLQYVRDEAKKRDGLYCIPTIETVDRRPADWMPFAPDGSLKDEDDGTIHADEDRHVRCDQYRPRGVQQSLFKEETA